MDSSIGLSAPDCSPREHLFQYCIVKMKFNFLSKNASASTSVRRAEIISTTELDQSKASTTSRPSTSKSDITCLKPSTTALSVSGEVKPQSQNTQRSTQTIETSPTDETAQLRSLNTHERQTTQAKRPVQITLDTEEKQSLTLGIQPAPSKPSTYSKPPNDKSTSLLPTTKELNPLNDR